MLINFYNYLSQYGDPEQFHEIGMKLLKLIPVNKNYNKNELTQTSLGWNGSIGLAAGFDKNAEYLNILDKMGFGAIEIGTVTPMPQHGNLKPRIKKIHQQQSILNWMGFPSLGMHQIYKNLKKYQGRLPIGINIGKNKDTPSNQVIEDYLKVALKLNQFASYITINVSSPNTPGLRSLQNTDFLQELLSEFKNNNLDNIYIKISPDLSKEEIKSFKKLSIHNNLKGFIATNTSNNHHLGAGGISGRLIKEKSYATILELEKTLRDTNLKIIACGGIDNEDDIIKYKKIGIDHFQVYTSFVYHGPKLIYELNQKIKLMQ